MSTHTWVVLVTVALLVGLLTGAYSVRHWMRSRLAEKTTLISRQARREALTEMYQAITISGTRYEIRVVEFHGPAVNPEMRWRWVVWDADRAMRTQADLALGSGAGVAQPYMLGNAPTRPEAEAQALAWVAAQGARSVVVS